MQTRKEWLEIWNGNPSFNFTWQPTSHPVNFERLRQNSVYKQVVNHFERHEEITTKSKLFKNMKEYCKVFKQKID